MVWAKFDDGFAEHEKVAALSHAAFRLHVSAICWCARQETDGHVGAGGKRTLGATPKLVKELVDAGLWDVTATGHVIHDYLDYNPSHAQLEAQRKQTRTRVQKHRERTGSAPGNAGVNAQRNGVTNTVSNSPPVAVADPVTRSNKLAAADPRPVSLPRAPAPEAAAAAAVIGQPSKNSGELPPKPPGLPIGAEAPEPTSGTHRAAPERRADTQVRERLPGNLEDALRVPVCERAALVVSGRVAAQWVQPERWPEVVEVAAALAEGEGRQPLPLGRYDHDAGVRAVVELYAAGFVPSDVKRVARRVPTQAWWTAGDRKRGLANLSPEVMRRGLDETPNDGGLLAAADRAREARLRRSEPESGPMPVAELVASFARGAS